MSYEISRKLPRDTRVKQLIRKVRANRSILESNVHGLIGRPIRPAFVGVDGDIGSCPIVEKAWGWLLSSETGRSPGTVSGG